MKNLLDTIPSLNDKISEVENLTSQFSPVTNITENIKKIKELIENARDAANRVSSPLFKYVHIQPFAIHSVYQSDLPLVVIYMSLFISSLQIVIPMKFTGVGHVELRPPNNLEDLKAYTSMSLSLQRPAGRGDGNRRRRQSGDNGDMFVLYLGNRDVSWVG